MNILGYHFTNYQRVSQLGYIDKSIRDSLDKDIMKCPDLKRNTLLGNFVTVNDKQ